MYCYLQHCLITHFLATVSDAGSGLALPNFDDLDDLPPPAATNNVSDVDKIDPKGNSLLLEDAHSSFHSILNLGFVEGEVGVFFVFFLTD